MRITARDRLHFPEDLADTRRYGRGIAIVIPTLAECPTAGCGYDPTQDSAIDPSCSVCGGLGQIVETWAVSRTHANIRVVDQSLLGFGQTPAGAQIGDTFLTIGPRDRPMIDRCYNSKDAYISVDGRPFRPNSIEAAGLGHAEEYVVLLASFHPKFRAGGY